MSCPQLHPPGRPVRRTLTQYQLAAMRTAALPTAPVTLEPEELMLLIAAIGSAGEAGEALDHVKKWLAQGHPLDREKLDGEVGDQLWYLALYATARGKTLDELAQANIEKLARRYPRGHFETERSQHRQAPEDAPGEAA